MHTYVRRLSAGLLLALMLVVAGSDGGRAANIPRVGSTKMILTRIEPDDLTKYLHKIIQAELKVPAPDERSVNQVRALALLIASEAQNSRGARDAWQRAALRNNAVKIARALAESKIDAARKHSATLFDIGAAPADTRRVDLKQFAEQDEVETLFMRQRRGGLDIEVAFQNFAKKAPAAAAMGAEAEHVARMASITAAMADLIDAYAPDKKVGNKDPKDWKLSIAAMRSSAAELEAAAKAKDARQVRDAARKVNESCMNCHSIFRD